MEEKMYHYKYPHPSVTTDCVIFGYDGTKLNVLLIERGIEPFKGRWAFPGGFIKMDETALMGAGGGCRPAGLIGGNGAEGCLYPPVSYLLRGGQRPA